MTAVNGFDEEEHASLGSETEEAYEGTGGRSRMVVLSAAGLLLVASCATLFFTATAMKPKATIMARELIESPETVDILADNMIALGHDGLSKEALRDQIMSMAHARVARLKNEKPELYRMQISQARKDAVLRKLKSTGDPRIHSIQNEIMAAMKETVEESKDHEALKRHLVEKLQPHMRQLRGKSFTLKPNHFDKMRLVKDFDRQLAQLNAKKRAIVSARRLTDGTDELTKFFDDLEQQLGGGDNTVPACTTPDQCDFGTCLESAMNNDQTDIGTCFDGITADLPSMDELFGDDTTEAR